MDERLAPIQAFFAARGWTPAPFQEATWAAFLAGESGLVHVPTGMGKTLSAWGGPLMELAADAARGSLQPGLQVLYLSPLRALSRDLVHALQAPVVGMALPITVGSRTGDTTAHARQAQNQAMPHALVTTPESATLLLCRPDAPQLLGNLRAVILDEWHELMGTKRGTQVELLLSRLRTFAPRLRTWALSATLANLDQALEAAVGPGRPGRLVGEVRPRDLVIDALIPPRVDAFPWAGHLGMAMLEALVGAIDISTSTLVFTNVRSQTERWYQAILDLKPEWADRMALHHGSLERGDREAVEQGLRSGELRLVVCTSSLDLGVDFDPVDQVFQIGSPRGVARLLQRAGRSGHRPGARSRIVCVPTHALEMLEIEALRRAVADGAMESRRPLDRPWDVLVQHMVTCAMGGGFTPEGLWLEVRGTSAFARMTPQEYDWCLQMVTEGGRILSRYPEYRRVESRGGVFRVVDDRIARTHRMNVGTIVSDAGMEVVLGGNRSLGTTEEVFIASLRPGQKFLFAGRVLQLVRVRGQKADVKVAQGPVTTVPRWGGGKLPITEVLSRAMRGLWEACAQGEAPTSALMQAAAPVLAAQRRLSRWPQAGGVLVEACETREGHHLFVFPMEGRLVHEGIAAVLALRLATRRPATFAYSVNDYGLELLCEDDYPWEEHLTPVLFDPEGLDADTEQTVNLAELARYRFREVARVSVLVPQNHVGKARSQRQLHGSASLLYDVFQQHDPDNLLLEQARREVMQRSFEQERLRRTMARLASGRVEVVRTVRPTPLAFPLIVERIGAKLSTEALVDRVARMKSEFGSPPAPEDAVDERGMAFGRLVSG
jgi:ATP-dependent Lhr-like helicase